MEARCACPARAHTTPRSTHARALLPFTPFNSPPTSARLLPRLTMPPRVVSRQCTAVTARDFFESVDRLRHRRAADGHGAGCGRLLLHLRAPCARALALCLRFPWGRSPGESSPTWRSSSTGFLYDSGIGRRCIFLAAAATTRTPRAAGGGAAATAAATRRARLLVDAVEDVEAAGRRREATRGPRAADLARSSGPQGRPRPPRAAGASAAGLRRRCAACSAFVARLLHFCNRHVIYACVVRIYMRTRLSICQCVAKIILS